MKYFRASLVTVKSLIFSSEIVTKINTSSVKESGEVEIGTILLKSNMYVPL